jgi:hypothetical protein
MFSVVVDDFGVKYVGTGNTRHLVDAITETYETTIDLGGTLYCGITLKWDYVQRTSCKLSIPNYATNSLHTFHHPKPTNQPMHHQNGYGQTVHYTDIDRTPAMNNTQHTFLQRVVGKCLFYAHAVNPTMLHELSPLASAQSKGTQATIKELVHFLNYCESHPSASSIRYEANEMVFHIHSDASYLPELEACSRASGNFYLSKHANSPPHHHHH